MADDAETTMNRLPTVEEILAGETQAGVAKPPSLVADEDDGTVHRVGSSPVPMVDAPRSAPVSRWRSFWTRLFAAL